MSSIAAPQIIDGSLEQVIQELNAISGSVRRRVRVVIWREEASEVSKREHSSLTNIPSASLESKTISLLNDLDEADEHAASEEILQGRKDWEAFRDAINETRQAAGIPPVYSSIA